MQRWWAKVKRWFNKIFGRKAMSVQTELGSARRFGAQLEELVVRRCQCPDDDRNILLVGYWALILDYHKGINTPLCSTVFARLRKRHETDRMPGHCYRTVPLLGAW